MYERRKNCYSAKRHIADQERNGAGPSPARPGQRRSWLSEADASPLRRYRVVTFSRLSPPPASGSGWAHLAEILTRRSSGHPGACGTSIVRPCAGAAERGRWQSAKTVMPSQKAIQGVSGDVEARGQTLGLPLQGSVTALTRSQPVARSGVASDTSSRLIANKALHRTPSRCAVGFPRSFRSLGAGERQR